jgi:hypothetical protein
MDRGQLLPQAMSSNADTNQSFEDFNWRDLVGGSNPGLPGTSSELIPDMRIHDWIETCPLTTESETYEFQRACQQTTESASSPTDNVEHSKSRLARRQMQNRKA